MKSRIAAASVIVGVLASAAVPAQAARVEQISMKSVFNADVIVNGTKASNIDTSQDSVDQFETSFVTQSAAEAQKGCKKDPDGLPDDGVFKKTKKHPAVDLAYSNSKNGKNARRSFGEDSYVVAVPRGKYEALHIFAASGQGNASMEVDLTYTGSSGSDAFWLPDWFALDPSPPVYPLVKRRDRAHPAGKPCYDANGASMWGIEVDADETQRLKSVTISRPDGDGTAVLSVFGMTGVKAK